VLEDQPERLSSMFHLGGAERRLPVEWRIAGGQEQGIPFSQRDVEHPGQK
jgi:hypothetical protein